MSNFFEKIRILGTTLKKRIFKHRQNIPFGEAPASRPLRKECSAGATGGFTLIELLACLGIFAVVTGVVLFNYGQFNSNVLITNYAYDVALTIRQAQVYGVAVRGRTTSSGTVFGSSYGVHFEATPGTPLNSFVSYADSPDDTLANYYEKSPTDESLGTSSLPGSYTFSNFCVVEISSLIPAPKHCLSDGSISALDISFKRPEPDAIIKTDQDKTGSAY